MRGRQLPTVRADHLVGGQVARQALDGALDLAALDVEPIDVKSRLNVVDVPVVRYYTAARGTPPVDHDDAMTRAEERVQVGTQRTETGRA